MWLLGSNVVFKDEPITGYYRGLMLALGAASFPNTSLVPDVLCWIQIHMDNGEKEKTVSVSLNDEVRLQKCMVPSLNL